MTGFRVLVDDNAHYQEEHERYELGAFATYEEALAVCRRIVDEFLDRQYAPGMAGDCLYELYVSFGEDPFISPRGPEPRFSAWSYARQQCDGLCAE